MLAFDGGSTKTDVVLVSRAGTVMGRARAGPSNHQLIGVEGTIACAGSSGDRRLGGRTPAGPTPQADLPDGCVLPRRHRPARGRRHSRRRDRGTGVDGTRHRAQRHVRRLANGHDVPVGYRRGVRDGNELCRRRPRREDGSASLPSPSCQATSHRVAHGSGSVPSAWRCVPLTAGGRPPCSANWSRPTSVRPMPRRCSPASIRAPSRTHASSSWPACSSTPPPGRRDGPPGGRHPWPTRSWPSSGPRW